MSGRRYSASLAGAAFACSVSFAAVAADPAKEIATAAFHADLATKAADLKGVRMHLHHVVNCLVGPKGEGYSVDDMNPCKEMGDGAMMDVADTARRKALDSALYEAREGLDAKDMGGAKKAAEEARDKLKAMSMMK